MDRIFWANPVPEARDGLWSSEKTLLASSRAFVQVRKSIATITAADIAGEEQHQIFFGLETTNEPLGMEWQISLYKYTMTLFPDFLFHTLFSDLFLKLSSKYRR